MLSTAASRLKKVVEVGHTESEQVGIVQRDDALP